MRREEIMKADLLSEVVLLSTGLVIVVSLLIILAVAVTQVPAT